MSSAVPFIKDPYAWLGMEAPRYTSYPTAHHFSPQLDASRHQKWLEAITDETNISVYVHIPYCRELCWFCGCHTKMTKRYEPIEKYVRVLLQEIEILKRYTGGRGKVVNIHFGGGSPSLLEPNDLTAILQAVASTFKIKSPGELAIELDPRTTTPRNIATYADLGFNRVSIGIQDFDPVVQQAINRVQTYPMVASVMQRLSKAGIHGINCDLIYGLPHQTQERFRNTLEKSIALNPSRIALFSYAHMPQLKKHQRMIDDTWLPSETEKLDLYSLACDMLERSGYAAIGMDHFAKCDDALAIATRKHKLRRNFQGYVTDATDVLIGLGSSAISQFPQGYAQNSANTHEYEDKVSNGELPIARGLQMSKDDQLRKAVIDEIMCYLYVDLKKVSNHFSTHVTYFSKELEALQALEDMGIVRVYGTVVEVSSKYRMAARVVASVFDTYRGVAAGRYSKVA